MLAASARVWAQAGNDDFARRIPLTGSPVTAVSNLRTATHEAGEPKHAYNAGTRSLWWTWTAPATGTVNFSTFGGGATPGRANNRAYTRAVAVYTGGALTSLSEVGSAGTLNTYPQTGNAPAGPSCNVPVTAGTTYQIAVDGPATLDPSDDGTVVLAVSQAPAVYSAAGAGGAAGGSFTYTILASNSPTGFSATNLPVGLSMNPSTGDITGTLPVAGTYTIGLAATGPGGTGTGTLTLVVSAATAASPAAPVITGPAAAIGCVGVAFSYSAYARSAVSYTADGLPPGVTLDATSGSIFGTPTTTGLYNVAFTATNAGGTGRATVTLVFTPQPTAVPVITSPAMFAAFTSDAVYYPVTATNGPTSFAASGLPAGLSIDAATGVISGVLVPSGTGTFPVVVTAANNFGQGRATIVVVNGAGAPGRITSALSANGVVNSAFSYAVTTNYGANTSFTVSKLPPGLSLNASTGVISGQPTAVGTYTATLSVSTPKGTAAGTLTFNIATSASALPVLTSGAGVNAAVGDACYHFLTFGNSPTSVNVTNLPVGLGYDPVRKLISGSPTTAGTFSVGISAANGAGTTYGTLTFAVTATYNNYPKIIGAAGASAPVGTPFNYTSATDQPSAYSFAANNLPPGLTYNASTLKITGTPTAAGVYTCTLVVSTPQGQPLAYLTIAVGDGAAAPPVIGSAAATVGTSGAAFSYALAATGSPSGYTAGGLPAGLSLDPASGTISGTPTAVGTFSVPVTATNAAGTGSATLTLVISTAPPSLNAASLEISATVGTSASVYRIPAANGATSYAASGLPPGLSLDAASGVISGTPTATGLYQTTVSAANASGSAGAVIDILVKDAVTAPTFSSFAADAVGTVGASFSQTLSVSSGGTVTYAASGLPPGMSLNTATGQLFGAPTAAGTYSVALSATNAAGSDNAVLTLLIAPAPGVPVFSGDTLAVSEPVGVSVFVVPSVSNATTGTASGLPPGVSASFGSSYIALRGSPTVGGVYPVTFTAANATGSSSTVVTLIVSGDPPPAPTIASPTSAAGTVGAAFSYTIYANVVGGYGVPTSFGASGLPGGLQVNAVTGEITGTPTTAGTFWITVMATNAGGTGSALVSVSIAATSNAVPVISSAASVYYTTSTNSYSFSSSTYQAFSYAITASSSPTSYAASGLPAGLVLSPATGVISGRLQTVGTFSVGISATNAAGTGSAVVKFMVPASPPSLSIPLTVAGTVGGSLAYNITPYAGLIAAGYNVIIDPTTYLFGGLPPGLSFNSANGLIAGTPSQAGTFVTTLTATAGGVTGNATLTLSVLPAPSIPATPVYGGPAGTLGFVGVPFNLALGTAGLNPDGALPAGLTYDAATGALTGLPTAAGGFDLSFSAGGAGGRSVLNLRVATPDLSLPQIVGQPVGGTVPQGGAISLGAAVSGTPAPALQWTRDGVAVPGATGSVLQFNAAQPADAGTYVLTAVNSSGRVTSAGALLVVTQTYGNWQAANFSPAEITAGLAADGYDFNGDGLPNLLEYALGRNPRTGQGGNLLTATRPAGGVLQFQFARDTGRTDLVYTVEASSDLLGWTAIARSTAGSATANLGGAGAVSESVPAGGVATVTVTDGQGPGPASRFLRLRVDRP